MKKIVISKVFFVSIVCSVFCKCICMDVDNMESKYFDVYNTISALTFDDSKKVLIKELKEIKKELNKNIGYLETIPASDSLLYEGVYSSIVGLKSEQEIWEKFEHFLSDNMNTALRKELKDHADIYGGNIANIIYVCLEKSANSINNDEVNKEVVSLETMQGRLTKKKGNLYK